METRINTGAIFKNDNKKADNHPDYKGKVNVNGKEMEVALWMKTSAKGVKFMSASFSEPYIKTDELQNKVLDTNDDLPF
jgi:uncharacterized protein (DUF736 family)